MVWVESGGPNRNLIMSETFSEQIQRFYEAHRQELYTYAVSLTGRRDLAEDVVHMAFCNLLHRRREPRELRPYVFRCIRNAAVDELRRQERVLPRDSIFTRVNGRGNASERAAIEDALAGLNEDEREAIVLKVYDGMTFKEVAAARRVSVNTAASWYRRGIEKMRAAMREKTDEDY